MLDGDQQNRIGIPAALCKTQQTCVGFTRIPGRHQSIGKTKHAVLVTWFTTELLEPFRNFRLQFYVDGQGRNAELRVGGGEVVPDPKIPVAKTSDGKNQ